MCVCVCVCVCARACMCECVCVLYMYVYENVYMCYISNYFLNMFMMHAMLSNPVLSGLHKIPLYV